MNKKGFSRTSAVLITLVLSGAVASAKTAGKITVADEGERTLESIEHSAVVVKTDADQFKRLTFNLYLSSESQGAMLMAMRDEINRMGKEFRTLDAEREALPSWEQQVVTETLPLLKDTAANTDSAIQYLNDNRPYLWGETYRGYAERIWQDSEQMVKTLRTHLQLAKLHDKEQHLDNSLGIAGGQ